jgi:hypothetical protein
MLKKGFYIAEKDDDTFGCYRIVLEVKETEKSYILKMKEYSNRYSYDHVEVMFKGKEKEIIPKGKGRHAVNVWSDHDFTIYPFRAGIPFYFTLMEGAQKDD